MVIIGALSHLVNMPHEFLEEFVEKRFSRGREGDEEIIRTNILALRLGREHIAQSGLSLGELAPAQMPDYQQLMLKGNEAAIAGSHRGRFGLLRRLPPYHLPLRSCCTWNAT